MRIESGNVVVVTGASSGIGRALCMQLAALGCKVAAVARRGDRLLDLKAEAAELPGSILPLKCDVRDLQAVQQSCALIKSTLGEVDFAFLCAGITNKDGGLAFSAQGAAEVMASNYFGVTNFLHCLLPDMQCRNKGTILAVSSSMAVKGFPRRGIYCASKAALTLLFESLRIDFSRTRINFILAYPPLVETEMLGPAKHSSIGIIPRFTAAEAARIMIDGVKRGKHEILFRLRFHALVYCLKIVPSGLYRWFWGVLRR